MRLFKLLLVLQALLLGIAYSKFTGAIAASSSSTAAGFAFNFPFPSGTKTTASPGAMTSSARKHHLICNPPFPMADMAAFQPFLEACALVENQVSSVMTDMDITEEHLRYVLPTLPEQLHMIGVYAYFFELQHGCLTSDQKKTYCTWLLQLRGDVTLLLAKMGGSDNDGHDNFDLETLLVTLESILSDMTQISLEMCQIMTEIVAHELQDPRQRLHLVFEKLDEFKKLVGRAEDLEKIAGCPKRGLLAIIFSEIKEMAKQVLAIDFQRGEALMGGKDEL